VSIRKWHLGAGSSFSHFGDPRRRPSTPAASKTLRPWFEPRSIGYLPTHARELEFALQDLLGNLHGNIADDSALAGRHIAFGFFTIRQQWSGPCLYFTPNDQQLAFPTGSFAVAEGVGMGPDTPGRASSIVLPAGRAIVCPSGRNVTLRVVGAAFLSSASQPSLHLPLNQIGQADRCLQ
jgi:hypothetical protein